MLAAFVIITRLSTPDLHAGLTQSPEPTIGRLMFAFNGPGCVDERLLDQVR